MTSSPARENDPISIRDLTYLLNDVLESGIPKVRFQGEISEVTFAKSGHLYVTLKDAEAQIQTVMWRSAAQGLKFRPEKGMAVVCEGKPNVYAGSGRLQIVVVWMALAGEGALQKKFLELKAKLEREGLFDPARKRALPFFPRSIGVVTSGTGAVIHDVMVRIRERMPSLKVYLVDVRVQGEGAAKEIAAGVQLLNDFGAVDVIIVCRGGGSLEDLWAFNEEEVVRAIFASRIPVISGVGHEVDYSLSDFVADVRAPTPTAAAEIVIPKRADLLARIHELDRRLADYDRWFQPRGQQVDLLDARLERRIDEIANRARDAALRAEHSLRLLHPQRIIEIMSQRIEAGADRLQSATERTLQHHCRRLDLVAAKLDGLNPLKVLNRGYALVESKGHVVIGTEQLQVSDEVVLTFGRGQARATVDEIFREKRGRS